MIEIYLAALELSVIHALIPNHWIPLVALARMGKWSRSHAAGATVLAGGAHVASTVLIGLAVGALGVEVLPRLGAFHHWVAPTILFALGVYYLVTGEQGHAHDFDAAGCHDQHGHTHPHHDHHEAGHHHHSVALSAPRVAVFL